MKKLLSLLAALGMAVTTSATAATVVSCVDWEFPDGDFNEPETNEDDGKYASQDSEFKTAVSDILNNLVDSSKFTTTIYGNTDNGVNSSIFGVEIEKEEYKELIGKLQNNQKNETLISKLEKALNIADINKQISEIAYQGETNIYSELFGGMGKDNIKAKTSLKIEGITFEEGTSTGPGGNSRETNDIKVGTVSIGIIVEVGWTLKQKKWNRKRQIHNEFIKNWKYYFFRFRRSFKTSRNIIKFIGKSIRL